MFDRRAAFHLPGKTVRPCFVLLSAFYLIGAVLGALFPGIVPFDLPSIAGWSGLGAYFWFYAWPLFMAFLFSFTALGIAAQPLLLLYRGFQIAASAAGAADRQSLYVLLITNGLSGLVSLIAVFILSLYGFFSSGVLFSAWLGKRNAAIPAGFTVRQTVNLLFSLSLVFLAAVCSFILAFYLQV